MKIAGRHVWIEGRLLRVARLELDKYDTVDDPGAIGEALRESPVRVDLFTFMQKLPDTSPKYAYAMEWDNVAALTISSFEHWWTEQINDKTRNVVRVAERKGLATREVPFDDALVRGISAVYDESPVRQGKRFRHYGKDLETVRRENGTFLDRSRFIGAFLDSQLVGFAKLVCDEDHRQAGLMQIVSMIRHRDKAPTNALIAAAVRSCAERRIAHLLYASFAYGNKREDSLTAFKRHNGFRRVDLARYYLPLTWLGRGALRLGLHHRLRERIPEPLLARVRAARSRWYARRLPRAKG
ncbi:MAG: hypothetical protein ACREQQ_01385 [Candidatus Binatia bacterium]